MAGFSSHAKRNADNRSLQKSSGMKLFTKFGTGASENTDKKKIRLSDENLADANQIRNRKLINTVSIVLVLAIAALYFAVTWF